MAYDDGDSLWKNGGHFAFFPVASCAFRIRWGSFLVRELRWRKGPRAVFVAGLRTSSGQQFRQWNPFVQEEFPLLWRKKGSVGIGPCFFF